MKQQNIDLVLRFYEEVFNAHDISKLDEFMRDDYMQHNATVADGKEGFIAFTQKFFTLKPKFEIYKVFANDNDEVAVFFKCTCEANGMVNKVCDIYRLQDGKLASGADGWGVFSGLYPTLQYRLTETKAPEGYQLLTEPAYEGGIDPEETLIVELTVVNAPVFELPMTGSTDSALAVILQIAGALALIIALLYIVKKTQ